MQRTCPSWGLVGRFPRLFSVYPLFANPRPYGYVVRGLHTQLKVDIPQESFRYWDDQAQGWRVSAISEPAIPRPIRTEHLLPDSFAIVQVGGRQYRITKGDLIITETLATEIGEKVRLKKVLLLASKTFTVVGCPLVEKAVVEAVVEEQTKAAKVIIFKKKRRKNYKRTKGHRHPITLLRIGDIRVWYENLPPLITTTLKEATEIH